MVPNFEPQKWRDGIDPFALPLCNVRILEILGYPHAANQVFYLRGINGNEEHYYYLKYAHHVDANFKNEVEIISQLHFPNVPKIVEYDATNFQYELTEQIEGKRLSVILAESPTENTLPYMYEYGQTLAKLHIENGCFNDAPHRRFHDIPEKDFFKKNELEEVYDWLLINKPMSVNRCFIHGDFHYANILWKDKHISGVLDFELAGMGNREFDIAWALILRPGQQFMKSDAELQEFIRGYTSITDCNGAYIRYYMVLIYCRFLKCDNEQYEQYVREWINKAVTF